MKLLIQIPCLNEQDQLPAMLADLPRFVEGFDSVEWLVVDDGSTDRTVDVALENGVDHIVRLPQNRGLASAFQSGLDACLKLGADVVVNTDADNQYEAAAIPGLVAPLLAGKADIVVGDRDVRHSAEFSWLKIRLQLLGSWVVRQASGTDVADVTSGFRAYSRDAMLRLVVINPYTYTIESIIQAGRTNAAIESAPVRSNLATRESRLVGSMWGYVRRNALTILRVFAAYQPLKFFSAMSAVLFVCAAISFVPFIKDWAATGSTDGHLQSIIVGSTLTIAGFQTVVLAVVGDLIASHRAVSQQVLERVRKLELSDSVASTDYIDLRAQPPSEEYV